MNAVLPHCATTLRISRAMAKLSAIQGDSAPARASHPSRHPPQDELEELGISPTELARQIHLPPNPISQLLSGKRSITEDTALPLGHWFDIDPQFWLNLQSQDDLVEADWEIGAAIRHLPTRSAHSQ